MNKISQETPRESFRKIMHYKKPERLFNWNWTFGHFGGDDRGTQFWQQTIDRWYQEGLPAEIDTQEAVNDYFQVDRYLQLRIKWGIWPESEKKIVETSDEFEISYNEEGMLVKQFKGKSSELSMPEYIRRPIATREDWNRFKRERLDPEAPGRQTFKIVKDGHTLIESSPGAPNFNQARNLLLNSHLPIELFVGSLFGVLRNWLGLEEISYALHDDENWIAEMMEHLADLYLSVVKKSLQALNVPVDFAVWWEDMAYNAGPLISPAHFKKLMVPNYRPVNEELHKWGIDVVCVDSDGNCEKLIPLWLESGINCVFPNEVAAGMDVMSLRKKFGPELLLIGGIDKRALSKDNKSIQDELQRRLPLLAQGGYLPCVDHSVPPDISFENYTYYWQQQLEQGNHILKRQEALYQDNQNGSRVI